jgi:hypothetical protein
MKPIYIIVSGSSIATVSDFSVNENLVVKTDNASLPSKIKYDVKNQNVVFLTLQTLKNYLVTQGQNEARKILTPRLAESQNVVNNSQNQKTIMDNYGNPNVKMQDLGIVTGKTPMGKPEALRVETGNGTGVTSTYQITIDTRLSAAANTFLLGDGMGLIARKKSLGATDAIITGTFDDQAISTLKQFALNAPMATRQYQFTTNDSTGAIYQTPFLSYGFIDGQNVYVERPINVQRGRNGSELDKSVRWMPQLNYTADKMNALVLVVPVGIIFSISFEIHSYAVGTIQGMFLAGE